MDGHIHRAKPKGCCGRVGAGRSFVVTPQEILTVNRRGDGGKFQKSSTPTSFRKRGGNGWFNPSPRSQWKPARDKTWLVHLDFRTVSALYYQAHVVRTQCSCEFQICGNAHWLVVALHLLKSSPCRLTPPPLSAPHQIWSRRRRAARRREYERRRSTKTRASPPAKTARSSTSKCRSTGFQSH